MTDDQTLRITIAGSRDRILQYIISQLMSIEADIQLLYHAEDNLATLRKLKALCPHIFIYYLNASDPAAVALATALHSACSTTRLIVLSPTFTTDAVQKLIAAGAYALLTTQTPLDDLVHVIYATRAGQMTLTREIVMLFAPELNDR